MFPRNIGKYLTGHIKENINPKNKKETISSHYNAQYSYCDKISEKLNSGMCGCNEWSAMDKHVTMEGMFDMVFSMWSMPRLHNENLVYLLYTSDLPSSPNITNTTFADNTAILAIDPSPTIASQKLQNNLDAIQHWLSL
jgi:hypothetical protein